MSAQLVLDTGAAMTTIAPRVARALGYSARDRRRWSYVHSAIGQERGYVLRIARIEALGFAIDHFSVHVFDLGHDIDGLLGLDFLDHFNYEVRSAEGRILLEPLASAADPP